MKKEHFFYVMMNGRWYQGRGKATGVATALEEAVSSCFNFLGGRLREQTP